MSQVRGQGLGLIPTLQTMEMMTTQFMEFTSLLIFYFISKLLDGDEKVDENVMEIKDER